MIDLSPLAVPAAGLCRTADQGRTVLPASGLTVRVRHDEPGPARGELRTRAGRLVASWLAATSADLSVAVWLRSPWGAGQPHPWALVAGSSAAGAQELVVTFGRRWGGDELVLAGRRTHALQCDGLWIAEVPGTFTAAAISFGQHREGRRLQRYDSRVAALSLHAGRLAS